MRILSAIVIALLLATSAEAQCRWGHCYKPTYTVKKVTPQPVNNTTNTHTYQYTWNYQWNVANAAAGDAIPGALSYNRPPFDPQAVLKDALQVEKLQASRTTGAVEAAKTIALAEIEAGENADLVNALRAMVVELKRKKGEVSVNVQNDYTSDSSESHSSSGDLTGAQQGVIDFIDTYCYRCHGDDSSGSKVVKGGLDLTDLSKLSDEQIDSVMTAAIECGGTTKSGKKVPAMPPADQPQPGWREKRFLFEVWGNRK